MLRGTGVVGELREQRRVAEELAQPERFCTIATLVGLLRVDDLLETLAEGGAVFDLETGLVCLDGFVVSSLTVKSRAFARVTL